MRIEGRQAPVFGHLVYLYPFLVDPVLDAAVPAIILVHAYLAGGLPSTHRADQKIPPPD